MQSDVQSNVRRKHISITTRYLKQRFSNDTGFTLSNGSESNIFLVNLFVHMTFCLDLSYVFSTLPVEDKQIIN